MDWSLMMSLSVVIDDLDFGWAALAIGPLETDAPLIVDSDAVLPRSVSLEGFKAIARRSHQVTKRHCRLDTIKFAKRLFRESGKCWDVLPVGETFSSLIPIPWRHVSSTVKSAQSVLCNDTRVNLTSEPRVSMTRST
jgi:hypothetical protein